MLKLMETIVVFLLVAFISSCADNSVKTVPEPEQKNLVELFSNNLHGVLHENCSSCHGNNQPPKFAVTDPKEALKTIQETQIIDFTNPEDSRLLLRIKSNHGCGDPDKCKIIATKVLDILDLLKTDETGTQEKGFFTSEKLISQARKKDHPIQKNGYFLYEAEDYVNSGTEVREDETGIKYVVAKDDSEELHKDLIIPTRIDAGYKFYLWVKSRSPGEDMGSLNVDVNKTRLEQDSGFSSSNEWSWSRYNNAENLVQISGTNVFIFSQGGGLQIDRIVLTQIDTQTIDLKRDVLSFSLKDLVQVEAWLDIVVEKGEGLYRVGAPVITSEEPLKIKGMKVYLNGKKASNATTFEKVDVEIGVGLPYEVSPSFEAIPTQDEGGAKDTDKVKISFDEISVVK